ncbi:MAG TPA: 50S ribosomal protein L11 methyltransferase [Candidatus Saccharimonadales bacterium]|nr:50S ribosomal protein L11 methyltransferase [Candidatus Saccharimonadales bacterium]
MLAILLILFFVMVVLFSLVVIGILQLVFDIFLELPYVGANRKRIKTIIDFSQIKKGDRVIDLGSGDGRLLIASAKEGAIATGYEINPFLLLLSHLKIRFAKTKKAQVKKESLWNAPLKSADIIFVYALRKSMKKFEEFVYKNAKRGTRVVVNTNPFPNKKPKKHENGIFLYIV